MNPSSPIFVWQSSAYFWKKSSASRGQSHNQASPKHARQPRERNCGLVCPCHAGASRCITPTCTSRHARVSKTFPAGIVTCTLLGRHRGIHHRRCGAAARCCRRRGGDRNSLARCTGLGGALAQSIEPLHQRVLCAHRGHVVRPAQRAQLRDFEFLERSQVRDGLDRKLVSDGRAPGYDRTPGSCECRVPALACPPGARIACFLARGRVTAQARARGRVTARATSKGQKAPSCTHAHLTAACAALHGLLCCLPLKAYGSLANHCHVRNSGFQPGFDQSNLFANLPEKCVYEKNRGQTLSDAQARSR
jgi:hypothetical protein